MKNRTHCFLPRTLVLCFAPLLACASAQASVFTFNEQSSTNAWTLPTGTNLLTGATVTASAALGNQGEGTSTTWTVATDGLLGLADGSDNGQSVSPADGTSVTYALDLTGYETGRAITSFDAYGAWGNTGRDNLDFTVEYSTVAAPATFTSLGTVSNHTPYPGSPLDATHTGLTDTTGILASGVHSIRLTFNGQENGHVGYREFVLRAEPVTINSLNESNATNVWTFPAGSNLLNGATATPTPTQPVHGGDVASGTWATVTDNSVGTASNFLGSVTPNNGDLVTFPLDTSVNFNGYNLSSFDSYGAWANSGRDNQDFAILYSTVDAPTIFLPLAAVGNHTGAPLLATHTRVTPTTGFLAKRVAAIQLYFNQQENGYTGFREFIALGTAVALADPLTWTGASGSAGNADWIAGADNNWMKTEGGAPSTFNPLAALTFDSIGANRNITVAAALTASSLTFANDISTPYTVGGALVTVSNDIVSTGLGSATFNNSLFATTGVTLSGAGSLVLNSDLQSPGVTLSGLGSITLNAANPLLAGNVSVSDGTLNVANNGALEFAALIMTGGTANFTTAAPVVNRLSGTAGTIVLGSTSSLVATNLSVGAASAATITSFGGTISQATGDTGSLTKVGLSSLSLGGDNSYTGVTSVQGGVLEFGQPLALYHGLTASWTAANLLVDSGATLGFKVGGAGEFADSDLNAVSMGGFQAGSTLGLNATADFTLSRSISAPVNLLKTGPAVLTLTGTNSYTGMTTVLAGTLNAANPAGVSLPGNVLLGDGSADVTMNLGADNQFGPDSVITIATGPSVPNGKINLRGTIQTVAGLESLSTVRVALIQNDEVGQPGYTSNPGPASLTLNTAVDHSFHGLIRNQDGGPITLVKTGPATQEFGNVGVAGFSYNGPTMINEGTLKLNFINTRNTSWNSNITIASGATFELAGIWNFFRTVSGQGKLVKTGTGMISLCNVDGMANVNTYSGGTEIKEGILKFYAVGASTANGDGPGQYCVAGPMTPTNVITVRDGATMGVGAVAALGQSPVLPQYAPTIMIEPGGKLWGGEGTNIAFVSNINLDGATVDVTDGSTVGGFNTNMTFVGTVVVGGVSTTPSVVATSSTAATANISLGSLGLPGTTFQVANVTGTSEADLLISSLLKNVGPGAGVPSPLTKTGAGTMFLDGAKSYTGTTHVVAGELRLNTPYLADAAGVSIDTGAVLNLDFFSEETDTVKMLMLDGVQVGAGTYGSMTNTTLGIIQTPAITGIGMLAVTSNPALSYAGWALAIPNEADRGRGADPDGDGFTNLQEFLFGTSPTSGSGALATVERTGSGLIVRWNERADSFSSYVLRESPALGTAAWTVSMAAITDAAVQDLPGYVRKEAVIPITGATKFVRVEATE